MTPPARLAASIELLSAIEAAPRKPADAVANGYFRDRRFIGSGDRRSISTRTWAVIRCRRRLGWWLERVGLPVNPRLLVAVSLLTEGWALDGVAKGFSGGEYGPTHFTVPEAEALQQIEGQGLVHPDMPQALALEVPDWVFPSLVMKFGDSLQEEIAAMEGEAPLDLRVNLLKGDLSEARAALLSEGIAVEPTQYSPWGLRVPARRPVTAGKAFQSGLVEIQDEGSQLIAVLVDAKPGMRVADYCAGAGGKTLAIAMGMANKGHVVACDVSAPRLEGAVRRLRRAGVHNVEQHLIVAGDKWVKRRAGGFDRVLVDAPCTGTGTWRRNPDARQRLREVDLAELRPKQAAILNDAAKLVRIGGRLVYATCSVLAEENEMQVSAFLEAHADFRVVPLAEAWGLPGRPPCDGPMMSLTPLRHGTDGFFAAVLERRAA